MKTYDKTRTLRALKKMARESQARLVRVKKLLAISKDPTRYSALTAAFDAAVRKKSKEPLWAAVAAVSR